MKHGAEGSLAGDEDLGADPSLLASLEVTSKGGGAKGLEVFRFSGEAEVLELISAPCTEFWPVAMLCHTLDSAHVFLGPG